MPEKRRRLVAGLLFIVYFIVLFYFLFFSEKMGRTYEERKYQYNLVPFREIGRFLQYYETLGMKAVLLNIVGNVVAFMPFGAFLPFFSTRCRKCFFTVLYSLELSLVVELLQLVFKVGSFDVDDLILNTLGGILGYCVYMLAAQAARKRYTRRQKKTNARRKTVVLREQAEEIGD